MKIQKQKEQPKEIRRICMVSSAVFSAASCIYGWTAPIGAALGLAASLTEDIKIENKEEFSKVVERALQRTKTSLHFDYKKAILDELCTMEIEPDTLSELIKRTETYQKTYCTQKDIKEIISVFEMNFRDEIANNSHLSNLYILSSGFMTLEKLELINSILIKDEEKIDKIHVEVSGINKMLIDIENGFNEFINGLSFVLIAMAVFLGINIFTEYTYDQMMIGTALACYGISEFLVYFLNKSGYVMSLHCMVDRIHITHRKQGMHVINRIHKVYNVCCNIITIFIIPILITVACFLIIFLNMGIDKGILLSASLNLICGNSVSILIKNLLSNKNTDDEQNVN
ncbi:MAG: hypothetical protein K2I22_05355 [Lachnospiraceae bacterium]|nr:hypothetical protein [Lachnospiraceae bacterium]